MVTLALCRRCQSPIEWGVFDRSSQPVALDPDLIRDGNLHVLGYRAGVTPVVRFLTLAEIEAVKASGLPLRRAHDESCEALER